MRHQVLFHFGAMAILQSGDIYTGILPVILHAEGKTLLVTF